MLMNRFNPFSNILIYLLLLVLIEDVVELHEVIYKLLARIAFFRKLLFQLGCHGVHIGVLALKILFDLAVQ